MPCKSSGRAGRVFFFILLALATLLFALVVRPIASALCLSAALAGVLWRVHGRVTSRLGGRRGLSAAALLCAVIVLLIAPIVAFSAFVIKEGGEGLAYLGELARSHDVSEFIEQLPPRVNGIARRLLDRLTNDGNEPDLLKLAQRQLTEYGGRAAVAVGATLSVTGEFIFQTAMMLIGFYFLLLQGDQLVKWLDELSPLKAGQTRELMTEVKSVAYAVILSTLITSAVQAGAALVGYFVTNVPHPLFFAGVTFFAAFIPAIGAGTVCLVAALVLLVAGHGYAALFLALWGLVVVSLVDNLVKPLLIRAGMQMNGAVVFFSLIGGLGAFGAVGLLLGPLFVALFLALLRMYQRDFRSSERPPQSET